MIEITQEIAEELIKEQFPEYYGFPITSVEKQGHDNRTYRLGEHLLIRMPTAESYALKVPKEQELLPKLSQYLSFNIPVPIKMGMPSEIYPFHFSIYKWLEGKSLNLLSLNDKAKENVAFELAKFLKELQNINNVKGPEPGQHNWWRGDHISVYDKGAREQIFDLRKVIDYEKSLNLWDKACKTKWNKNPVWIHGDLSFGNILYHQGKISAVIDFGGMAVGDPACDLVIAWTYFNSSSRKIFIEEINADADTWLRAKAWALWKASYMLCQLKDQNSHEFKEQLQIINAVLA